MADNDNTPRLISIKEAGALTSMSRTLITALYKGGLFPVPVHLAERRIAFVREEVMAWVEAKVAGRAAA